jgi:hypothetical protein
MAEQHAATFGVKKSAPLTRANAARQMECIKGCSLGVAITALRARGARRGCP